MNPNLLFNGLGSIGFFSTRIFLPALLTALFLRFGNQIPVLDHSPLVAMMHHQNHPTWFTSDACIAVLAVLSILEFLAQKNPDARRLMHEFDAGAKGVMALLTALGIASTTDTKFVEQTIHQAGFSLHLPAIFAAVGTVGVARIRGAALSALHEIDPDDVMRLQHLISWAEDGWVLGGVLLLFLSPFLMLILIGIAIGMLMLVRRYLESIEEHTRVSCASCGTSIYPSAMACPHCHTAVAQPHAVGLLGQTKPYVDPDPANHAFRLIEKKRCPVCATHLKQRTPHQMCPTCQSPVFPPENAEAYSSFISGRLPIALGCSALLSMVPFLGLVIGSIYYQFTLVYPFTGYLPFGRRFLLKWGLRIVFLILAIVQIFPGIGAVAVPVMALLSFLAYRAAFGKLATTPPQPRSEASHPTQAIVGTA
jgi:hypothetical protein